MPALLAATLAAGCSRSVKEPQLGGLYNTLAQVHGPRRNPVIVIPGILGSKLVEDKTGRTVWGAFSGGYANPSDADGARLVALPMRRGASLGALRDDVRSDGALDRLRLRLFGLPLQLNAYVDILGTLGVGGYRDELLGMASAIDYGTDHYTCFQFAYDWRRDNVENARRLHEFILEKRRFVQGRLERDFGVKDYPVRFDIIAHSMGGLVTRYYLRYGDADLPTDGSTPKPTWAGARYVERAVLVGTPNAGSAHATLELAEGIRFAAILPRYEPAVLGTMPSIYQLLPRPRHETLLRKGKPLDLYDPVIWRKLGWGLAERGQDEVLQKLLPDVGSAKERRRIALDHQRKCLVRARRFAAALDQPAAPPEGTQLYLFAGDAVETEAVVEVRDGRPAVKAYAPGDGTVLRSSTLLDERRSGARGRLVTPIAWTQVHFLFTDHIGITRDPGFSDNVLYLLLEAPRADGATPPSPARPGK